MLWPEAGRIGRRVPLWSGVAEAATCFPAANRRPPAPLEDSLPCGGPAPADAAPLVEDSSLPCGIACRGDGRSPRRRSGAVYVRRRLLTSPSLRCRRSDPPPVGTARRLASCRPTAGRIVRPAFQTSPSIRLGVPSAFGPLWHPAPSLRCRFVPSARLTPRLQVQALTSGAGCRRPGSWMAPSRSRFAGLTPWVLTLPPFALTLRCHEACHHTSRTCKTSSVQTDRACK